MDCSSDEMNQKLAEEAYAAMKHVVYLLYKFKLNKIAARWPAKAVAQFSTPK